MKKTILPITVLFVAFSASSVFAFEMDMDSMKEKVGEEYERMKDKVEQEVQETTSSEVTTAPLIKERVAQEVQNRVTEAIRNARERFGDQILEVSTRVEALQARVEDSSRLSDDEKSRAKQQAGDVIHEFREFEGRLNEADSVEDLKQLGEEGKVIWDKAVRVYKKYVGLEIIDRFLGYIDRMEQLRSVVDNKLQKFESRGVDVSTARSSLTEFAVSLELAKRDVEDARDLVNSMNHATDLADERFSEAVTILRNAKTEVYDATISLRQAILNLRDFVESTEEGVTSNG